MRRVFAAAGDEKRPRCHQSVQLVQVTSLFDEPLIGSGSGVLGGGHARFAEVGPFIAEIPRFPVIHVWSALVEDDAPVGPRRAGELLV